MQEKNVGAGERILRFVVGLIIIFMALLKGPFIPTWAFFILLILGVALVLTGFIGLCPIYSIMGWSTIERKRKEMEEMAEKEEREEMVWKEKELMEEEKELKVEEKKEKKGKAKKKISKGRKRRKG